MVIKIFEIQVYLNLQYKFYYTYTACELEGPIHQKNQISGRQSLVVCGHPWLPICLEYSNSEISLQHFPVAIPRSYGQTLTPFCVPAPPIIFSVILIKNPTRRVRSSHNCHNMYTYLTECINLQILPKESSRNTRYPQVV